MADEAGGYDLYNIYDQCKLAGDDFSDFTSAESVTSYDALDAGVRPLDDRGGQCGQERALAAYANEPAVRTALHVPPLADLGTYK
jgi:hypothetical protein